MSLWRQNLRTQDDLKQAERSLRIRGFDDGLSGLPARSQEVVYQQAWKRGFARRRDLLLNDLDES